MTKPKSTMTKKIKCAHCGNVYSVTFSKSDYLSFKSGELVQNAFPYLTAGERELLITKTCDSCWDKFFPEED